MNKTGLQPKPALHFTPFQRILSCDFRLMVHILGTSSRGYCKAKTRGAAAAALCRAAAPQRSTALPRVVASRHSESPATAAQHRLPRSPSATGHYRAEPPATTPCRATYSLPAPGCRPFEIKPGWRVALVAPSSERLDVFGHFHPILVSIDSATSLLLNLSMKDLRSVSFRGL